MSQLPQGSLILVSGANGYIGSHIIDELLSQGYNVRGTVRDTTRAAWVPKYFDDKYGPGKFSFCTVQDFTQAGCFDEAVKGCDGFVHVASDMNFTTDPNAMITPMVTGIEAALESASKEPKIRSFVLTSSSTAAVRPRPNTKFHVDKNSWNEGDIRDAWADTWDDEVSRKWAVYGAKKAQGERAMWDFTKEKKPHFSVNAVLPNANVGSILDPKNQQGSAAGWITMILAGQIEPISKFVSPQYLVYVRDTAKLHAALVTDSKYNNERLLAFTEPFNWNDILAYVRKLAPEEAQKRNLPERIEDDSRDLSTVDTTDALRVLKDRYGQVGWTEIEQALRENIPSSLEALKYAK